MSDVESAVTSEAHETLNERDVEAVLTAAGHRLGRAKALLEPYDDIFSWLLQECEHCDALVVLQGSRHGTDVIYIGQRATLASLARLMP